MTLPTKLLREGVNCLAVEIHHAALRPEAMRWKQRYVRTSWEHVQLDVIRLTAEASDGAIVPNVARPAGLQVFNQDILNMPKVQAWLKTMKQPYVIFADYGESKIRHFHALLEEWLEKP